MELSLRKWRALGVVICYIQEYDETHSVIIVTLVLT